MTVLRRNILLLLAAVIMTFSMAGTALAADPAVITVDGVGEVTLAPDKAEVQLSVVNTAKTAQLAQADNAVIANRVTAALNQLGIYSKDIRTSYRVSPVHDRNDYRKITGYQADNTLTVQVNDINQVSTVIDTAIANGVTEVGGLSYGLKDESAALKQALQRAVADARAKADAVAGALGVQIVGVQRVNINGTSSILPKEANVRLMSASAAADTVPTPISAGTMDVTAGVYVEYQIR